MRSRTVLAAQGVLASVAILAGCATTSTQIRSNALEFLYPKGAPSVPASDVTLQVPVRVGVAFPPATNAAYSGFTEDRKQQLLERIAAAFRDRKDIGSVQTIPTTYLKPDGGFEDLDRVAASFGVDLMVLVSYEQVQFSDSTKASLAYWTIVGMYLVKGEKNETRTMLDAAVFDIKSRVMLFNASGRSGVTGSSTPLAVEKSLRGRSDLGFSEATDDLIRNLNVALDAFQKQVATGTVRGPGTPAVAFVDKEGKPVASAGGGGGAVGLLGLAAAGLLAAAAVLRRRARG